MRAIDLTQTILRNLGLLSKSVFYTGLSLFGPLPGRRFDLYGRRLALRHKSRVCQEIPLLLNPVSSVRYFEFDFVDRHLPNLPNIQVLDVSSPWLFGLFISENQVCEYRYTNLDEREFQEISRQLPHVRIKKRYSMEKMDATMMSCDDASFDAVVSISVVEHIPGNGDGKALKEMWRVLRPGGVLILTFPVSAKYQEEFRSQDLYQVGLEENDGQFFFQRFYDKAGMEKRLTSQLEGDVQVVFKVYGEREAGFFKKYEQRWSKQGIAETVKDPYLMARNMQEYASLASLPGMGVLGLCLRKVHKS